MRPRRWDFESVTAEARKYTKVIDFKARSRGAYKWAERNGVLKDVTAFMSEVTDAEELIARIRQELGTAARHAKVAHDICESVSDFYVPSEHDPEAISAGTYLDFDAQMYDQAAGSVATVLSTISRHYRNMAPRSRSRRLGACTLSTKLGSGRCLKGPL